MVTYESKLPSNVSSSELLRFTKAQQMKIIEGESCLWVEKRPFFLESLPQHKKVSVTDAEARKLFRRGAMVLRYTCDDSLGAPTFEYVWDDKNFDLDSLHKDAKRNVRKNLEECIVRPLSYDLLRAEGCSINLDVMRRQGRSISRSFLTDPVLWKEYLDVCETLPFMEGFGAFIEDRLCAFSLVVQMDDYCYTYQPYARADSLKKYSMNVLIYSVVRTLLARPNVSCVSYGMESFVPHPTLERFKLAMGCRKRPIHRRVIVNPLLRPVLSPRGKWIAERLVSRFRPGLRDEFQNLATALNSK